MGTATTGGALRLAPYVPRLAVSWLAREPEVRHRRIDAALAFVDVSGFTALTERLAARGKAGAEEVSDLVGGCFTAMLDVAYEHGGEMLKWGGDAALLVFDTRDAALDACTAASRMCRLMGRIGSLRTSVGRVNLRVSVGVHAGPVDLYLVGDSHRELVVTGPAATAVARMEATAEAGEVVVSRQTAAQLPAAMVGGPKGPGVLVADDPRAAAPSPAPPAAPTEVPPGVDIGMLLPPPTRDHLLGGGERDEHRHAAVAFVEFSGVDHLVEAEGPEGVVASLEGIVRAAQAAAAHQGCNLHASDIGPDGGKLLLLGGIPVVHGNDEERVLRAALSVVQGGGGRLGLRAGVNAGRIFMHESGPTYRRIHSFAGDAVNLAARVMAKAAVGQVLATAAIVDRTRSTFDAQRVAPFTVKGKSKPVEAFAVEGVRMGGTGAAPGQDRQAFVARQQELRELLAVAASVEDGGGQVVEIVAEPGMGKSVLVAQAMALWALPSYRLACEEYGRASPYLPFRWLLRALLELPEEATEPAVAGRLREVVATEAPQLEPWLPLLGEMLGVALPATVEVEQLETEFVRARLEEVVAAFVSATLTRPTAVVFEDAHDLDEASRSLLGRLAALTPERPWLLVVTHRPEGEPPLGDDAGPRHDMVLGPLPGDEAAALLDAAGDELALTAEQRRALVERSGGNPLFIHELVVAARAAGSVEGLPDRLEPLLAAKLDRLDPADRQILRAAAVLGVQFDPAMVADLLDDQSPGRVLDDQVWRRLSEYVVVDRGTTRRFSHALVRDAAYEGLSYRRRRHLHGLAADAVERRSTSPLERADLLSLHTLYAGRFEDAWRYGRIAGERALSVYANADAVTFLSRALEAAGNIPARSRPPTAPVAEELGDAAERAGQFAVAHRGYGQARRGSGTDVDRARLMRKTGVIFEHQSRYSQALQCYTRARAVVPLVEGPAGAERAELAVAYAATRYRQGRIADCLEWAERAVHEAETAGHRRGLAHALYLADQARSDLGQEAGEQAARALSIFEELDDLVGQGRVLNNLGRAAYQHGRWEEALDYYRRSKAMLGRAGDAVAEAVEDYNIGEILSDQGHYQAAATMLEAARQTWRAAGYPIGVAVATSNLGRQAARMGRLDEATLLLGEAVRRCKEIGSRYYAMEAECRLAELAVLRCAPDAVDVTAALLEQLAGEAATGFLLPMARRLSGIALARAGRFEEARAALDGAVEAAEAASSNCELALGLAARAVVSEETGREANLAAHDARHAVSLLESLGVVDVPVTALDDRWPARHRAPGRRARAAGPADRVAR